MTRDARVARVTVNGDPLPPRYDLRRLGQGFEWGRPSPGSSQLALAMLCDYYQHAAKLSVKGAEKNALRIYHDFKFRVLAEERADEWEITSMQITSILQTITETRVWP